MDVLSTISYMVDRSLLKTIGCLSLEKVWLSNIDDYFVLKLF